MDGSDTAVHESGSTRDASLFKMGVLVMSLHMMLQAAWMICNSQSFMMEDEYGWKLYNLLFCIIEIFIGGYLMERGAIAYGMMYVLTGTLLGCTSMADISILGFALIAFMTVYVAAGMILLRLGGTDMAAVCISFAAYLACAYFADDGFEIISCIPLLACSVITAAVFVRTTYLGRIPNLFILSEVNLPVTIIFTFGEVLYSLSMIVYLAWFVAEGEISTALSVVTTFMVAATILIWIYGISMGFIAEGVSVISVCLIILMSSSGELLGFDVPNLANLPLVIPILPMLVIYYKTGQKLMTVLMLAISSILIYESLTESVDILESLMTMNDALYLLIFLATWYVLETAERPALTKICNNEVLETCRDADI